MFLCNPNLYATKYRVNPSQMCNIGYVVKAITLSPQHLHRSSYSILDLVTLQEPGEVTVGHLGHWQAGTEQKD